MPNSEILWTIKVDDRGTAVIDAFAQKATSSMKGLEGAAKTAGTSLDSTTKKLSSSSSVFKTLQSSVTGVKSAYQAMQGVLKASDGSISKTKLVMEALKGVVTGFLRELRGSSEAFRTFEAGIGKTGAAASAAGAKMKYGFQFMGGLFSGFRAEIAAAGGGFNIFNAGLGKVRGLLSTVSGGFKSAANAIGTVGMSMTVASAAFTAGTVGIMKNTVELAGRMKDMSEQTGISTEALSEYKIAAEKSGTSLMTVAWSMRYLAQNLRQAEKPGSAAAKMFKDLGIDVKTAEGKLKSAKDVMPEVAEAFKNMTDESKRMDYAWRLLGRSGMQLIPMLIKGKKGFEDSSRAAKEMNAIFSKGFAEAASQFGDKMTDLRAGLLGIRIAIMERLLPAAAKMVDQIKDVIKKVTEWVKAHPELVDQIGKTALKLVALTAVVGPLLMALRGLFSGIAVLTTALSALVSVPGAILVGLVAITRFLPDTVDKTGRLKTAMEGLTEAGKMLVSVFYTIGAVFATLKTSFNGLIQLFNVLKSFWLGVFALIHLGLEQLTIGLGKFFSLMSKLPGPLKETFKDLQQSTKEAASWFGDLGRKAARAADDALEAATDAAASTERTWAGVLGGTEALASFLKGLQDVGKTNKEVKEEAEAHARALARVTSGYQEMDDAMESASQQAGLVWRVQIMDKIQSMTHALKANYTASQATTESYRKAVVQIAQYKMMLGLGISSQEAWTLMLARGVKTIAEQKKEAGYLTEQMLELNKRFAKGVIDAENYSNGLKAIEAAASSASPELAGLARVAEGGWQEGKKKLDDYYAKLLEVTNSIQQKRREWGSFNKELAKGFKEDIKSQLESTKDLMKSIDAEMHAMTRKKRRTEGGIAADSEIARAKAQIEAILETQKSYEKLYKAKLKALEEYYAKEEENFAHAIERYDKEAALIKMINEYRIRAARAATEEELEIATQNYEKTKTAVANHFNEVLAKHKAAGLAGLAEEKNAVDKQIAILEGYRKKAEKMHDLRLKAIQSLNKKHLKVTEDAIIAEINAIGREADKIAEALTVVTGLVGGIISLAAQQQHQKAADLRAQIKDDMSFLEVQALQTKIRITEAWGNLWDVLGQGLGGLLNRFKELKDAGASSAEALKKSFEEMAIAIAGAIGAAIGNIIGGGRANYASEGAAIGSLLGLINPVLGAVGAFVGGIVGGLFKKKKSQEEKDAEQMLKWIDAAKASTSIYGKITDSTAKSLAELRKKMSQAAAEATLFSNIISDVGVNQQNANALWVGAGKILDEYRKGTINLKTATEQLGASFSQLVAGAQALGTLGSKAMTDFINKVRESGLKIEELTSYIKSTLGVVETGTMSAVQGLMLMVAGATPALTKLGERQKEIMEELANASLEPWKRKRLQNEFEKIKGEMKGMADKVVPELARIERQAMATFNAMIKNGASFNEAIYSIAPVIDMLVEKHKLMGTEGSKAIQELMKIRNVQKANEELFAAVEGNLAVLNALANTGSLNQETFSDAESAMLSYFQKLQEAGLTQNQALSSIAPTLERLDFLQKEYGYTLDANTKHIIEAAKEQGLMQSQQLKTTDIMMAGFGEIIRALGGRIPEAFKKAMETVKNWGSTTQATAVATADSVVQRFEEMATVPFVPQMDISDVTGEMSRLDDAYQYMLTNSGKTVEAVNNSFSTIVDSIGLTKDAVEALSKSIGEIPDAESQVKIRSNEDDVIQAQGGGAWKVASGSQLFNAHAGELVQISRNGANEEIVGLLKNILAQVKLLDTKVDITNEFSISTIDADSFDSVIRKKIVPQLEAMSKKEAFLVHPKGVRGF